MKRTALILTGILIGLLAISQYQSVPLGPFRDRFQGDADRQEIVESLSVGQEGLKSRITELRSRIASIQQEAKGAGLSEVARLDELEALNGLTPLRGKGIEILLDDSPAAQRAFLDVNDNSLVHAADLRDIVNLLYSYGATAVAINGERILPPSPIVCVGNNILVNHTNLVPPFRVEALGPTEKLYVSILNTEKLPGLYGRKEVYGLTFNITVKEAIEIPVYNSNFSVKHLRVLGTRDE